MVDHINEVMSLERGFLLIPRFEENRYVILLHASPQYRYLWLVPKFDYLTGLVTDRNLIRQRNVLFKIGEVLVLSREGYTMVRIPQPVISHLRLDPDFLVRVIMGRPDQLEIWKKSDYEAMEHLESLEDAFAPMSARGL